MSKAQGNKVFLTLAPAAGIAITYFSMPFLNTLDPSTLERIPYIPYLIIIAVMMLGAFFSRHRVTFISALLGIAYLTVHNVATASELTPEGQVILALASILLPLNIAFISSLKEHPLFSIHSFSIISVIVLQLLLSYWLIQNHPQVVSLIVLFTPSFFSDFLPTSLSLTILVAYAISFSILIFIIEKRGNVFEFSFAGALISTLFFFHSGMQLPTESLFFATASLIMAWGLIHNSYLIAYIDELTELPGRRAMNEETARLRGLYSIAMLDIDHFKKFNDTYGHDVGDQVLKMVASKIGAIGGGGKAFRYGGEEFAVVFSGKDSKAAFPYLSSLRETVDHSRLVLRNQDRPSSKPDKVPARRIPWQEVHVTISIGVADSKEDLSNIDDILKAADDALYRSKEKGRNRISQYATKDYSPDFDVDETME